MREPRRLKIQRPLRHESLEARLMMSAQPVGEFTLDPFEQQVDHGPQLQLVEAHEQTGLAQARSEYGLTGRGQTVVVIDSGIAYDHQALGQGFGAGRHVVGGWDFAENDGNPYDDGPNGSHGTHVAGIIGSTSADHPGVAPGADLVALRVFDDNGSGNFAWLEQALRWVHENRNSFANPITTVNISIGSNWNAATVPSWAMLEDEFAQLEADGIFVAVAAGNSFSTYNAPGLSYPAASNHVVPVASVDANGSISSFSQRLDRVIAAPGRTILSTVPDYRGNQNGAQDDYVNYSGTSMASPYVAGTAVLLREAYAFAGQTNVTQDTIYDLMRSTADTVYDPATGQSYYRLNVDRALDAVMPDDDFGNSSAAALSLGNVAGTTTVAGHIAHLGDLDYFRFTAGATGQVTLSVDADGTFQPTLSLVGGSGAAGDTLTFNAVAGQTYTFGLGGTGGLAHYTLDVSMDTPADPVDWGTVAQQSIANQQLAGQAEFELTASRDGTLTIEAAFQNAAGNVDLRLYNSTGQLVGSSTTTGNGERIDVAATAGQRFTLRVAGANNDVDFRLTNLVRQANGAVTVHGTPGNDAFAFTAGTTHRVEVNGVAYQFTTAQAATVQFLGGAGSNSATLTGGTGNETAEIDGLRARLNGQGINVTASDVGTATVRGGGGYDSVVLLGTNGDDAFTFRPAESQISGSGRTASALDFDRVEVHARAGRDTATFYDSAGNDTLDGYETYARFTGPGFECAVYRFDSVRAYGSAGYDSAVLRDTGDNDALTGSIGNSRMSNNGGLEIEAIRFDSVRVFASQGNDTARLFKPSSGSSIVRDTGVTRLVLGGDDVSVYSFDTVGIYNGNGTPATTSASLSPAAAQQAALAQALAGWGQSAHLPSGLTRPAGLDEELAALDDLFARLGR
jgi:subtilisin family serine protease